MLNPRVDLLNSNNYTKSKIDIIYIYIIIYLRFLVFPGLSMSFLESNVSSLVLTHLKLRRVVTMHQKSLHECCRFLNEVNAPHTFIYTDPTGKSNVQVQFGTAATLGFAE